MRLTRSGRSEFLSGLLKSAQGVDPYVGDPNLEPELYKPDSREPFMPEAEESQDKVPEQVPYTQLSAIQPSLNMLLSWIQEARAGEMELGPAHMDQMEKVLTDAIGVLRRAEHGEDVSAPWGKVPF
jgi:hypothetical protein